ncbi:unnamed protein product [Moneuplotes crassus]|uniref:Uncharacterized protein n=1 Tax=Euplotes crassus TaxID=5936 RepID=A0AAD1UF34_EUPCR|nr:unnamed protein product [Moneuplotes crassus]
MAPVHLKASPVDKESQVEAFEKAKKILQSQKIFFTPVAKQGKSRNQRKQDVNFATMNDHEVQKLFATVKNDLKQANYSLSRVLNSNKLINNFKPRIQNRVVVEHQRTCFIKLTVENQIAPLKIEVLDSKNHKLGVDRGRQDSPILYISEYNKYPDEDDHQKKYICGRNKIEYHPSDRSPYFLCRNIFICIKSSKFYKLNFYYCFGNQALHIRREKRQAASMIDLFSSGAQDIGIKPGGLRNMKIMYAYKTKINELTEDNSKQKELFTFIQNIRKKRQRGSRKQSKISRSVVSLPEIEQRHQIAKDKRTKIDLMKRKKNLRFLETNKILKREKNLEFIEKAKETAKRQRIKFFIVQIHLKRLIKTIEVKCTDRQIQRDKVQMMYKSYFVLQISFSRHIKRIGPSHDQRIQRKILNCLTFLHNAKKGVPKKVQEILARFLRDTTMVKELKRKSIIFGRELYIDNRK